MVSRASIGVPVIFVSSFLGLTVPAARADEAYLCGPDRVVYVKIEDLERMKKTDACVAAYYGLTVADGVASEANATDKAAKSAPEIANPTAPVELKSLSEPEHEIRGPAKFERSASLTLPSTAPGTDYRNVRVINADSGASQWFKHDR